MAKSSRPQLQDRLGDDNLFRLDHQLPRLVEVEVDTIAANPDQPRQHFDEADIDELAGSIERHGLLQPILVQHHVDETTPDGRPRYVLIAGERRLRATRQLGRSTIAAIITQGDSAEIALIENLQRQNLSPIEEAEALARLMAKNGYTQETLGQAIGRKQNTISALLSLNKLPEAIRRDYPTSDTIGRSMLIELVQVDDEGEQLRLWETIKNGELTVRDLRKVKRSKRPTDTEKPDPNEALDNALSEAAARLQRRLEKLPDGSLIPGGPGFEALEALQAILERKLVKNTG